MTINTHVGFITINAYAGFTKINVYIGFTCKQYLTLDLNKLEMQDRGGFYK